MDASDQFLTIPQDDDSLQGESSRHDGHGHAYTSSQDDELYLERLETLYEKQLGEIDTFARREGRPCEDVRKSIAQWYSKTLFDFTTTTQQGQDQKTILSSTMRSVSDTLESLQVVAGYQSFFLTVNPNDNSDEGFLGGTILGREFWRGHRGCGAAGALAFKLYCQRTRNINNPSGSNQNMNDSEGDCMSQMVQQPQAIVTQPIGVAAYPANIPTTMVAGSSNTPKKNQASAIKAEVYASVRSAIRTVTGRRNAEMKWSNHDRLIDSYGVRLEGWPASVPKQNPSVLSAAQNKTILDALEDGSMRFVSVKTATPDSDTGNGVVEEARNRERMQREREIFEDAVDFTAGQGGREDAFVEHRSAESAVGESGSPRSASLANIAAQQNNQVGGDMTPGALQLVLDMETLEEVDPGVGVPKETTPSHPASSNAKVRDEADEADGTGTRKRRRVVNTGHM